MLIWILAAICGVLFFAFIGKNAEYTSLLKTSRQVAGEMFFLGMFHKTRGTPIFLQSFPDKLRFYVRYADNKHMTTSTLDAPIRNELELKYLPGALGQWVSTIEAAQAATSQQADYGGP